MMQCKISVLHPTLPVFRPQTEEKIDIEVDASEPASVIVEMASKRIGEEAIPSPAHMPRLFIHGRPIDTRRVLSDFGFQNGKTYVFLLDCRPYFPKLTPAQHTQGSPKYLITHSFSAGGPLPQFKYRKVKTVAECIYGQVHMYVKEYLQSDGSTYLATNPPEYYAVKQIIKQKLPFFNPLARPLPENPLMELSIHQYVTSAMQGGECHPHVCKLEECCQDEGYIYAVMEAMMGGDGFDFVKSSRRLTSSQQSVCAVPEHQARLLYAQIVHGLKYLFDCKVCHCDLTLENIMLSGDLSRAVIIDFGMAQYMLPRVAPPYGHHRASPLVAGKPLYKPPECYPVTGGQWQRFDGFYGDLWSIGVLLFILLTGAPPVRCAWRTCPQYMRICRGEILNILEDWRSQGSIPNISASAKDLLFRLLIPEPPAMRLRLDEILEHPWVKGCDELLTPYAEFIRSIQSVRLMEQHAFNKHHRILSLKKHYPERQVDIQNLSTQLDEIKLRIRQESERQPELRARYTQEKDRILGSK